MVSITFSIPKEIRRIMREFPEVNWTHIVRSSIEEKAKKLALKKELMKKFEGEKEFIDWSVNVVRKGRH